MSVLERLSSSVVGGRIIRFSLRAVTQQCIFPLPQLQNCSPRRIPESGVVHGFSRVDCFLLLSRKTAVSPFCSWEVSFMNQGRLLRLSVWSLFTWECFSNRTRQAQKSTSLSLCNTLGGCSTHPGRTINPICWMTACFPRRSALASRRLVRFLHSHRA